jgi:hypothetical protein
MDKRKQILRFLCAFAGFAFPNSDSFFIRGIRDIRGYTLLNASLLHLA